LGALTKTEVTATLQKAQALIVSSVCYEGMPMTILEAFSTGTTVIASNLGAMKSLIVDGYNGFHFESGNANDLKKCVEKFDALFLSEKKQIGANAYNNYLDCYSPELQQSYFDSIYNKALKKK
jgi:glycosyltransferase involved in cell wall biosynthesis